MRAVATRVGTHPREAVRAGVGAISPQVRSPRQQRRDNGPLRRIVVEVALAIDLILNRPFDGETRLEGIRLGIQTSRCESMSPAGEISDFDIREIGLEI